MPAWAGLFNHTQPVPDWGLQAAKTKTPAYVKDAAAVILYDEYVETIDANGRAVEREREAIRILKPQGRHNSCAVSFDEDEKINYFRVWTLAADEKQYQAQETDFVDEGDTSVPVMLSSRKTRVAHPPAVDVGAVEICESEEQMEPYITEKNWSVQNGIPVVFEALEVVLPPGRAHTDSWFHHDPVKAAEVAPGHFRWELHDIEELNLRDVPAVPDWPALAARMTVQWGAAAVEGRDKQWRAIGQWVTQLEAGRPAPSPEIAAKTQDLVAGAPDFYTKLSRIAEYIQKNVRYFIVMRGIGGLQAHYAKDIFQNRYGDCKDKTTLLIAMLEAAGIHAYYVPVDDRRGVVAPEDPSLVGDHMIAAIEVPDSVNDPRLMAITKGADGKRYLFFDPTNERTPAGNLPSYLQGGWGTLAAGEHSQAIALPVLAPAANGTERKGSFTLKGDGTLSGAVDLASSGSEGAEFRYFLKNTEDKERREYLEKRLARDLPGVALEDYRFVQPPSFAAPVEFHMKVSVSGYAHTAGALLLVRPRVVESDAVRFDQKPRTVPIDLGAAGRWHDVFEIALPAGWTVDETPDAVDLDTDFVSYHAKSTAAAGLLRYERTCEIKKVQLPPERAAEFARVMGRIGADEKGTAVLKKQ
jgi:transglutaminase-like putative cysteine protease